MLDLNRQDAEARGIQDGDLVAITSRYGETRLHARISEKVNPGIVYTTFHFAQSKANAITSDLSDWATNCPEYKVTAVEVAKVPVGKAPVARKPAEAGA